MKCQPIRVQSCPVRPIRGLASSPGPDKRGVTHGVIIIPGGEAEVGSPHHTGSHSDSDNRGYFYPSSLNTHADTYRNIVTNTDCWGESKTLDSRTFMVYLL